MSGAAARRALHLPIVVSLCVLAIWHSDGQAVGEAGGQFLKIGVGARAQAMGGAFVALADDASAVYWNPAGLARQQVSSVLATYGMWFEDMGHHSFGAAVPMGAGCWGAMLCYSPSGDIPHVAGDLTGSGSYDAYDISGTVAYARRVGSSLSVGAGVKVLQSKIEDESATGYAADVGALYEDVWLRGLSVGLAVQNIGPELKFIEEGDPLPLTVRGGAGYLLGGLTVSADWSKPIDSDGSVHVGGEYVLWNTLALRAGFLTRPEIDAALTTGLGLVWKQFDVGYAYVPFEEIEGTHHISAGLTF